MLFQRIAYGALAIAVLVGLIVLDVVVAASAAGSDGWVAALLARGSFIPLATAAMTVLGGAELARFFKLKEASPHAGFAYVVIVLTVLSPWLSSAGWLGLGSGAAAGLLGLVGCTLAAVLGVAIWTVARSEVSNALSDFAATITMVLYLGFLGAFSVQLRCSGGPPGPDGAWLLLTTLLVAKASDIGAFFAGVSLGRHKLAPRISPGKTVEGAVGGLAGSALVAVGIVALHGLSTAAAPPPGMAGTVELGDRLSAWLADATRCFASTSEGGLSPTIRALSFGIVMSLAGQMGDLLESCFKRDVQIKDSGKIMPRFGGILDLIDSPIVAVPVGWFLLTAIWGVA